MSDYDEIIERNIKTAKELEDFWNEKGYVSKHVINVATDFKHINDSEVLRLLDSKTVTFVQSHTKNGIIQGYIGYISEIPQCCEQGATKQEVLFNLLKMIEKVMKIDESYFKWLDVIQTFEKNKDLKDYSEIIAIFENKYSIV